MSEVLIIVHLLVVLALIGLVLLQRSEGGGLGMGQSGGGGFLTSRGKANVLTRTTAILAGLFFATSLGLAILAGPSGGPKSVFDATPTINDKAAPPGGNGILDQLPPSQNQQQTAPLQPALPPPATPQAPISR